MRNREIERKFLLRELPVELSSCPRHEIEQAYLCTRPVVRVRREDDEYYLTYKGKGKGDREEYNLLLNREAYEHLLSKADGNIIRKTRYEIQLEDGLIAELDVFDGVLSGLSLMEIEFETAEQAAAYVPPVWAGEDVTEDGRYHNSHLKDIGSEEKGTI